MGQGSSTLDTPLELPADLTAELVAAVSAVREELDAGHRAYVALQCFQRLFSQMESPDECLIARTGWLRHSALLRRTVEGAQNLFDGGRVEALGLEHFGTLRSQVSKDFREVAVPTVSSRYAHPADAAEEGLRALGPWVLGVLTSVDKVKGPPRRCTQQIRDGLAELRGRTRDVYWARMKVMVQRSVENLAEGISIFVATMTCLTSASKTIEKTIETIDVPRTASDVAWDATRDAAHAVWGKTRGAAQAAWDSKGAVAASIGHATRGAAQAAWARKGAVAASIGRAGSGLFSFMFRTAGAPLAAVRGQLSAAAEARRLERFNSILREHGMEEDDWSDVEELCGVAKRTGALEALQSEGYCTPDGDVTGGDSGDASEKLMRILRRCTRRVRTQDSRSTPMDLDLLHNLLDVLEGALDREGSERELMKLGKRTLEGLVVVVGSEARSVARPRPLPRPGSSVRFA